MTNCVAFQLGIRGRARTTHFRYQIPNFRFEITNSRFQITNFRFQIERCPPLVGRRSGLIALSLAMAFAGGQLRCYTPGQFHRVFPQWGARFRKRGKPHAHILARENGVSRSACWKSPLHRPG